MPAITDEQIKQAKSVDLLTYLQTIEPHSIRKCGAGRHCLTDHDSFILSNGRWYWFSQGIGGYDTLSFLVKVRGVAFAEAVLHLTGDGRTCQARSPMMASKQDKPKKPFALPPANANNDKVYAYLRGRDIDGEIIHSCFKAGTLYQSKTGNCVFVGYDGNKARFACERGTEDNYKKDVSGSDKRFSFALPPKNPDSSHLAVMEAPVDVLSHASLHKLNGDNWDGFRLSLGGVSSLALMNFLERHPRIESVLLCLDSDKAGRDATTRIIKELLSDRRFSHLQITAAPPPLGKDYSDTLQAVLKLNKEHTRHDRPKEAASLF